MKTLTQDCINWIKDYYKDNPDGKAIIGISGGKDSTVAAALCVEALGADRVIGVLMPNTTQLDIMDSIEVCKFLGIEHYRIDIGAAYFNIAQEIAGAICGKDEQPLCSVLNNHMYMTNTPARLRMTTLYGVAAFYPNSRVVNTCNRSEDYVGYSTKYGDAAGDFSPLGNLTVREVLEIGDDLGLPEHLVHKTPSDGMCGKTDEDNLGFTYQELDDYIRGTGEVSEETEAKIVKLHTSTRHKYTPMPTFLPAAGSIRRNLGNTPSPTEAGGRNVLALEKPIKIVYEGAIPLSDEVAGGIRHDVRDTPSTKRGTRRNGNIMDDCSGGIIDPNVVMSIAGCGDVNIHVDIAPDPGVAINAALENNLNTADVIKSIEKEMWRSVMSNEIRGIK